MSKQLLDGDRKTYFMMDPFDLTIIGLDTKDGPEHEQYDPRINLPVDQDMVDSIVEIGVQTPILVSVENDKAIVISGVQRTRAARAAIEQLKAEGVRGEKAKIRVKVVAEKKMERKLKALARIHLNEQVVESPPLMKAAEAYRLQQMGLALDEIGRAFKGVKPQTIAAWISVYKATGPVKKAVEDGRISMTQAANVVAGLTDEEQAKLLEEVLAEAASNGGRSMPTSKIKAVKKAHKKNDHAKVAPKRRTLRRLVEDDKAVDELPAEFLRGVRFAIGDLPATAVKGLSDHLKNASVRRTGPS